MLKLFLIKTSKSKKQKQKTIISHFTHILQGHFTCYHIHKAWNILGVSSLQSKSDLFFLCGTDYITVIWDWYITLSRLVRSLETSNNIYPMKNEWSKNIHWPYIQNLRKQEDRVSNIQRTHSIVRNIQIIIK